MWSARGLAVPYPNGILFGAEARKNACQRALWKLGLGDAIHLGDLRHTFASLTLANGGDLGALMAAMGRKTLAVADHCQSTTEARAVVAAQSLGLKVEHNAQVDMLH